MPATKDSGKVSKFLQFLGIKKKQQSPPKVDPRIAELDDVLKQIERRARQMPRDNPKRAEIPTAVDRLRQQGRNDVGRALEVARGVLEYCKDESQKYFDEFEIDRSLGKGAFGEAFRVKNEDGQAYVVKRAPLEELEHERAMYERVGEHPNICGCYGIAKVGGKESLVLECIDGADGVATVAELQKQFQTGELPAEEYFGAVQYMISQMLAAVQHLEKCGVAHLDLKPDNVRIDAKTGQLKLLDFGVANEVGGQLPKDTKLPVLFTAPETFLENQVACTTDAFGVGTTAFAWGEQRVYEFDRDVTQPVKENLVAAYEEFTISERPVIKVKDGEATADAAGDDAADASGDEERFRQLLADVRDEVKHAKAASPGASTQKFVAPGRREALGNMGEELIDKACRAADLGDYAKAINLLGEAKQRLQDARTKKAGEHNAATLYTDFINKLMHPDPKQRLSAEQALAHPFMQMRLLDDAAASRVLQNTLQPPKDVQPPAENAKADEKLKLLANAVPEYERQVQQLKGAQPETATKRQALLAEIKSLGEEKKADEAWKKVAELRGLIAAAKRDRQERQVFAAEVGRLGGRVADLSKGSDVDVGPLYRDLREAQVLGKPGGDLEQGRALLTNVAKQLDGQLDHAAKRRIFERELAALKEQIDEIRDPLETELNRLRSSLEQAQLTKKENDADPDATEEEKKEDAERLKRSEARAKEAEAAAAPILEFTNRVQLLGDLTNKDDAELARLTSQLDELWKDFLNQFGARQWKSPSATADLGGGTYTQTPPARNDPEDMDEPTEQSDASTSQGGGASTPTTSTLDPEDELTESEAEDRSESARDTSAVEPNLFDERKEQEGGTPADYSHTPG